MITKQRGINQFYNTQIPPPTLLAIFYGAEPFKHSVSMESLELSHCTKSWAEIIDSNISSAVCSFAIIRTVQITPQHFMDIFSLQMLLQIHQILKP